MISVRLSKFQRSEISYKLDIMQEAVRDDGSIDPRGGHMAAHYGFATGAELDAMQAKLDESPDAPSRIVTLDKREALTAWGELENSWDIAADNADGGHDEDGQYARNAKRLKQAMDRIEEAAKAAGFDATTASSGSKAVFGGAA